MRFSIKKLILILVVLTCLFGTDLPAKKSSTTKIPGVYLYAGNSSWLSNNTINLTTTERDETDTPDITHAENPEKYFVEFTEVKIKRISQVVHIETYKQPFIFDLPPPQISC